MEAWKPGEAPSAKIGSEVSGDMDWIWTLKPKVVGFVSALKETSVPGFYRYSYSGDLRKPGKDWGLANAVFATKILYILESLGTQDASTLSAFIGSFQSGDGYISDPYLRKSSRLNRFKSFLRTRNPENLFPEQTKRAETRQSFAALECLGAKPAQPFDHIPHDSESIRRFIDRHDWKKPWAAGSHVSHLLFFLKRNGGMFGSYSGKESELIGSVVGHMENLRQKDGSWHTVGADLPAYEKVNGVMKILTGLEAAGWRNWDKAEQLIDLCLASLNDSHACNHFNITYVLHAAAKKTDHRRGEVTAYLLQRLNLYKKHYWDSLGGFSFYERRANDILYNARVTSGKPEPDIHGTILFVWGICLIADFLGIGKDLGMRPPVT
jgi:hypothetical protein